MVSQWKALTFQPLEPEFLQEGYAFLPGPQLNPLYCQIANQLIVKMVWQHPKLKQLHTIAPNRAPTRWVSNSASVAGNVSFGGGWLSWRFAGAPRAGLGLLGGVWKRSLTYFSFSTPSKKGHGSKWGAFLFPKKIYFKGERGHFVWGIPKWNQVQWYLRTFSNMDKPLFLDATVINPVLCIQRHSRLCSCRNLEGARGKTVWVKWCGFANFPLVWALQKIAPPKSRKFVLFPAFWLPFLALPGVFWVGLPSKEIW